jgi:hypothetical protein
MKTARLLTGAVLFALTLAIGSCSERGPTTPTASLDASDNSAELLGLLGGTVQRIGLLTCRPLPAASAQATIGAGGGTITVGPHQLVVPAGALAADVTITAYAPSGSVNRVEFQPHGLVFTRPASLTMSYANCDLLGSLLPKRIAYIDGNLTILEYLLSVDDLLRRKVTGRVEHFSDYAIAW